MARQRILKNSFSGGEMSPQLSGRGDLRSYENGMGSLRNVFIYPTGGVYRRPGLRHIGEVPFDAAESAPGGRLIAFEFNVEQVYLLVLRHQKLDVYREDELQATLETPWTAGQLDQINWTQSADTLLVVHPDVPPRKLTRTSHTDWTLDPWTFFEDAEEGHIFQPHYKFEKEEVTLKPSGTTGTVTLTASADVFLADHVGVRLKIATREVEITSVSSPTSAQASVKDKENLANTEGTRDWEEQAFSEVRGWPVAVAFHQDRLVIGGSRDLPNRLWLSKSSDLFNFDLGEGLDDEGIEFAILSDAVNAVRGVFSGRHLQVFTSGAEWMVSGDPLTPTSIQLNRQTRIGSPVDRTLPPKSVDGATLFVSREGTDVREFLFADVEQAYQSNDLAMLTKNLINRPVDQDYDPQGRLFHMIMTDGTLASLTIYRAEQITAWTLQETTGSFLSCAVVGKEVYVLVKRFGEVFVERFDADLHLDAALSFPLDGQSLPSPQQTWEGLDHLEGRTVRVRADGAVHRDVQVVDGRITLDYPASQVEAGLPYTHVVEPLPVSAQSTGNASMGGKYRLVSLTLRLFETESLRLDTGRGFVDIPFKRFGEDGVLDTVPDPFTGNKTVRALGWTGDGMKRLWRIEDDNPLPFCLLSVLEEISANA